MRNFLVGAAGLSILLTLCWLILTSHTVAIIVGAFLLVLLAVELGQYMLK